MVAILMKHFVQSDQFSKDVFNRVFRFNTFHCIFQKVSLLSVFILIKNLFEKCGW
jgi:hypothetical protein